MQQLGLERARVADAQVPTGIRLIALLCAAVALYLFGLGALVAVGAIPFAWGAPLLGGMEIAGPPAFWIAGSIFAVDAVALWKRRGWARRLTVLLATAGIALLVPAISSATAEAQPLRIAPLGAAIVIRVVVIWYCVQESTVDWFLGRL